MRHLRQNTAVRITVGPFLDKGDGVSEETGLTVTSCHVVFTVDDDDGTAVNKIIDTTLTASGGNNDMVHIAHGLYDLELTAANTNYLGRAFLLIVDSATHCAVWHEFEIITQQVYDSMYGSDKLQVDAVEVSSDSTAADNLEAACDGNTYNVGGGAVVAASVTDKTGFSLSAAGISAIWDQLLSAITTASSIGKLIKDYLDAAISTRSTYAGGAVASVTAGVTLADDAITAAKFDESTAFPVKSADAGSSAIARVGADSDTLETLSDQIDAEAIKTTAIKAKTDAQPAILV